jgi:hypothetical protein
MKSYNLELSNFLDFKKMGRRDLLNDINRIGSIEKIEESPIVNYIKNLPKEIQKKIYIYAIKFFYREDIKSKPLYSIHNRYVGIINGMKKKVLIDNVHFLHLDCNTLPENKEYILGCQCDYCKSCPRKIKDKKYTDVMRKPSRVSSFLKTIRGSGIGDIAGFCNCVFNPNDFYEYDYQSYLAGYNFEKDSFYSPLTEDPCDNPIFFSSSITEMYKI